MDAQHVDDISVLILGSPALAPCIPINRTPLDPSMAGQTTRVVGFGRPTVNGTGGTQKLMGTGTWDTFTTDLIHFPMGPQHECSGDSGGPALMTIGGTESIIGTVVYHDDSACESG